MSTEIEQRGNDSNSSDIDYDDCFDLLSNHRRRYTLHYLQQNGDESNLSSLSEQVAAWENEIETEEISYDQRKRVYTSLQQVHLPRMDEMGIIEFDQQKGTMTLSEPAEELDIYLETVQGRDIPWSAFYLIVVGVDTALLSAGQLGFPFISAIPGIGWAVFMLTTFSVVSITHLYLTRTEMRLGKSDGPPELSQ